MMKRVIAIAILSGFLSASCKKNYNCTCTYIDTANTMQTKVIPMHGTKTTVQIDCSNQARYLTYYGRSVSCNL